MSGVGSEAAQPRPFEHTWLGRLFIFGGPMALLVVVSLGLWTSLLPVSHSLQVWAESTWVPGETVGIRVAATGLGTDEPMHGANLVVEQGEQRVTSELAVVTRGTEPFAQGTFTVPRLDPGRVRVVVTVELAEATIREHFTVLVAPSRPVRRPARAPHRDRLGDTTEPQPEALRLDLRPDGDLRTGFAGRLFVRVLDPTGAPARGTVEVALLQGRWGDHVGSASDPPIVAKGAVDVHGLLGFTGLVGSEVLEFELRALEPEAKRRVREVAQPGAVDVRVRGSGSGPVVTTRSLVPNRVIFIDVFGADGAFAATLTPLISPEGGERDLTPLAPTHGPFQVQASRFAESGAPTTAITRGVWPQCRRGFLVPEVRERLARSGGGPGVDPTLEAHYLAAIAREPAANDELLARERLCAFLLATLPRGLYETPVAFDGASFHARRQRDRHRVWRRRVRWALLSGGGVYLVALLLAMLAVQRRQSQRMLAALEAVADACSARAQVRRARRGVLVRGLTLVAIMAAALGLTLAMLERLLPLG